MTMVTETNGLKRKKKTFCPEKAKRVRERMLNKKQYVMFDRKVQLIKKHLNDSSHPLRWLQSHFSAELEDYY